MKSSQEVVHWLEQGRGARWVWRVVVVLAGLLLTCGYSWRQFHGVPTEFVMQQAVVGRQEAGEDRGVRRQRQRHDGSGRGVADAGVGETVQGWCDPDTQTICTEGIDGDQQDIGPDRGRASIHPPASGPEHGHRAHRHGKRTFSHFENSNS